MNDYYGLAPLNEGELIVRLFQHGLEKVRVDYDPPPIPIRDYDWTAHDDSFEPGAPYGRGRTAREALVDLLEQVLERCEEDAADALEANLKEIC